MPAVLPPAVLFLVVCFPLVLPVLRINVPLGTINGALEQQRAWQNEDWANKTSPQAQVRNMKAAGLNAGVIYGNGGAPSSDAGSVPQANPFEAQPVNYLSGIGEASQKFMGAALGFTDVQKNTIENAVAAATAAAVS